MASYRDVGVLTSKEDKSHYTEAMRVILLLSAVLAAVAAPPPIPAPQYKARRAELRKALPDSVVVLFGRSEQDTDDLRSGFFQEPNFYYLTGWIEPGGVLLIDAGRDVLFIPRKNLEAEKWTGPKATPDTEGIAARTAFDQVLPLEALERELRRSIENTQKIHVLPSNSNTAKVKAIAPFGSFQDPTLAIARLRMRKSAAEIAAIEWSTEVTLEGHRAAWKKARAGIGEYQVAAVMTAAFGDKGCERHAYAPIVGSGPNSTVLHYSRAGRVMDAGEVLLMDVAAECSGYASDVTRTIPVTGKWTARQREIYEIVLGAQKAAIAAIKPGMTIGKTTPNSIYKVAYDYINSHGKDKHGEPLGKYFNHGLGHHVGLEVHDAFDPLQSLEAGMVITVEPGIYIPEESLGVRIEDVVLVTASGSKVLSSGLPREADEVERALKR